MGLAIEIGTLADLAEHYPEGLESSRKMFTAANAFLAANGLPLHTEPEELPPLGNRCLLGSHSYSDLHYLRHAYAHRKQDRDWMATPLPDSEDPANDPVVEQVTAQLNSHLLCHSDCEGFYLPIDFPDVLFDETGELPGRMLGSSYRLREELVFVAPALGIKLDGDRLSDDEAAAINAGLDREEGLWLERIVWLSLFEAARLSIEHRTAICFM